MSKHKVNAYYDSDEGIAWGPYTAKEMKDDLQRPRPKPKHRRTVYKIACKAPSTCSSNDTMFTATSELEKENNSRICNIGDTNNCKIEGSSMTTYYTADETYTVASKGDNNDSVITISSDEEEDGYKERVFNAYGNLDTPIQIKKENRKTDQEVISIFDDSTDEKLSNHMPDKLEEEMTELSLSGKPNDSGMVETQFYPKSQNKIHHGNMNKQNITSSSPCRYSGDKQHIPRIYLEGSEVKLNEYGISENTPQSEQRVSSSTRILATKNSKSGNRSHLSSSNTNDLESKWSLYSNDTHVISENSITTNLLDKSGSQEYPGDHIKTLVDDKSAHQSSLYACHSDKKYQPGRRESNSSDYDASFEAEASNQIEEITTSHIYAAKVAEHHSNNNSPHVPKLNNSNNNNNCTPRITRSSVDNDILDSDLYQGSTGNKLKASSKESDASISESIHLDLSTDSSSIFDASCFDGKESWTAELDTTTDEDEPTLPKEDHHLASPVKPTKLTPAKCLPQKVKVTPVKTTPQFKDIVSPVRLYIQHSPVAHLKQNVVPRTVTSPLISPKTSPSVSKTDAPDNCDVLPPILYKPPGKSIVTMQSKQWFMPPSLGKHVKDPLVVKHEKKLNVQDVSRLSEKLGLDESALGSEADSSVNMSVLCVKKNFN
nr:unnamed protein product [Callosobruchus chinensis]